MNLTVVISLTWPRSRRYTRYDTVTDEFTLFLGVRVWIMITPPVTVVSILHDGGNYSLEETNRDSVTQRKEKKILLDE
jgi:hypothetical protein